METQHVLSIKHTKALDKIVRKWNRMRKKVNEKLTEDDVQVKMATRDEVIDTLLDLELSP